VILLPPAQLKQVTDAAESAYPAEACGLLVGRIHPRGELEVVRVVESPNLSATRANDRFEVDPRVRLKVMREIEDTEDRLIGLFHSHPDRPAQPSATDLDNAWEPDLVWLITSVIDGQAVLTTAHVLDDEGRQFRRIGLRTTDWKLYPLRDRDAGPGGSRL
jgi:proteasome lid subunit RPN8/RPN11